MAQLIQFKRRAASGIPDILLAGEPLYNVAENAFYIGTGSAVVRFDAGAFNGDCSTAAATAAKVVACPGIVLLKGVEVTIKFTETNTVAPASLTLNVGGTGAKPIYYRGANLPSANVLSANRTYKFRYNGTQWELIGDLDTDTTVGAALSSHTDNSTIHITSTERTNWDTAYEWGDHALAGYVLNTATIPVNRGGTGKDSVGKNSMLYASAANTYSEVSTSSFGRGLLNTSSGTLVSGLNAEKLSGYKINTFPSYISQVEDVYAVNGRSLYTFFSCSVYPLNAPTGAPWIQGIQFPLAENGLYRQLLVSDGSNLYFGKQGNGSWAAWEKLYSSNNSNKTTVDWSAKDLTLAGAITGATTITASSTIQATTAKLTNLSDGYLPYHVSDASGLANSVIQTNGVRVGINTAPDGTRYLNVAGGVQCSLDGADNGFVLYSGSGASGRIYRSDDILYINRGAIPTRGLQINANGAVKFGSEAPVTTDSTLTVGAQLYAKSTIYLGNDTTYYLSSTGGNARLKNITLGSSTATPSDTYPLNVTGNSLFTGTINAVSPSAGVTVINATGSYNLARFEGGLGSAGRSIVDINDLSAQGAATSDRYILKLSRDGVSTHTYSNNGDAYISGNVGIGTTATSHILDVYQNSSDVRILLRTPKVTSNAAKINFIAGTGKITANNYIAGINGIITQSDPSALKGELSFLVNSGDNAVEKMRITSSGNVGIGTTDPLGYKLYVSGTGHYTSNLSAGGTLGVTGNTTLSTATITSQLNFGSSGKWINYDGSANLYDVTAFNLSLKHPTPFIDFYFDTIGVFDGENWVGTSRIIEQAAGVLDVSASVKIPSTKYLQIGSARLTYETVGGVGFLKLAHSDTVTPMHLVTTGGQTMYSTGVPAIGGGGGATIILNGTTYGEGSTATIFSPTSIGYPGYILKADNPSGLPVWDNISNLLPDASTSVKGVAMLAGSGSATTVARSDHNHTGVYAAASHGHATLLYTELLYTDSYSDTHNVLGYSGTSEYDITLGNDTYKTIIDGSPIVLEPFISYTGLVKCTNGTLSVDTNTYSLSSHTHSYLPLSGGTITGNLVVGHATDLNAVRLQTGVMSTNPALGALVASGVFSIVAQETNSFGLHTWVRNTGDTYLQSGRGDANTAAYNIVLNALGGNVGIGMVPTTKLEVAGTVQASADYFTKAEYGGLGWKNSSNTVTNYLYLDDADSYIHFALGEGLKINNDVIFSDGSLQGAVINNYGVCATAAATVAKTVSIAGLRLVAGVVIYVQFTNGNTVGSTMTLNVNGTGAKSVILNGNTYPSSLENIQTGDILTLIYDGSNFRVPIGSNLNG